MLSHLSEFTLTFKNKIIVKAFKCEMEILSLFYFIYIYYSYYFKPCFNLKPSHRA